MPSLDTIFERARQSDGQLVDLGVADGHIVAIEPSGTIACLAADRIDLGERLVLPGFIDGHIHLDKSFVGDKWKPHIPCKADFDVRERVSYEKQLLAVAAPIYGRAAALLEQAICNGTTHMRSHVDVDASTGLRHLDAILALREAYRGLVSIEIVAFPQNGILTCPGTAALLDSAIEQGADVIGGLDPAGFDRNIEGQLDVIFDIAERRGVPIDIHLHDPHMLGIFELERIAERTLALGMPGRVAVSHAYCLGEVAPDVTKRAGELLANAGVAIMTNAPGSHPFPPVSLLREAGVVVFAGNDNIRDAWWPYGEADMLRRASTIGYRSGYYTDSELQVALDLITIDAARALGLPHYGLGPGCQADFVVLDGEHAAEVVAAPALDRSVYKEGKLVAENRLLLARAAIRQIPR